MHFHAGQIAQDIRHILQLDPVELDILARGKMPVAAIVLARNGCQHAHLCRTQQTVRHRNAQHIGVDLHVQPVLQAQDTEFVFRQFARQTTANLVAKLRDAFGGDLVIELIVTVHLVFLCFFVDRITFGHWQQQRGLQRKPRAVLQDMLHIRIFVMAQCHTYVCMFSDLADHHTDAPAAAAEPADLFRFVRFIVTHGSSLNVYTNTILKPMSNSMVASTGRKTVSGILALRWLPI